ncbi:MAG: photosynthetic reaction center cytochrome PufC, partial [Burkholderiaceae bacterium]
MKKTYQQWTLGLILGMSLLLTGCERPPKVTEQIGYRGTGMEKVINPRIESVTKAANVAPEALPPAEKGGKKASAVYKNVKVLGDLTENEFNRVMLAMTTWVSPEQGCTFCHNAANFAEDTLYQKVVARKMIEMT